jgi:two-component system, OmpR family, sensor histidine kinase CpxA
VDVEMRAGEATVSVVVRDHGPGLPEGELKKIFQPFYRVANARDRQSGGTGLGLAIADRVVGLHGGTIRAENAAPHGLRMGIILPRGDRQSGAGEAFSV